MISGIHDEHGVLTGIHGVSRDITGRKRVEEALRESQQRFQGLIETLYDWVWEVDSQGYFTYASPGL